MGARKARPAVGAAGQAKTGKRLDGAHFPRSNCTTSWRGSQDWKVTVADFLPKSREDALKLRELKDLLHIDERTTRAMIQRERRHVPILSDNMSGYWISDNEAEVRRFCASMRSRARQVWATAANVEKAAGLARHEAQQLPGQEALF